MGYSFDGASPFLLAALAVVLFGGLALQVVRFLAGYWRARRAAILERFRANRCAHKWEEAWVGPTYSRRPLLRCVHCGDWTREEKLNRKGRVRK